MSHPPLRYFPRPEERQPTAIADLPRPALAARIQALRDAHNLLRDQSARDGGEGFRCVGALKKELTLVEQELFRRDHPGQSAPVEQEPPMPLQVALAAVTASPYAPTEKQVAFYQRLVESPVFSEEERRRALEWLTTKATRQTIKDQIDWLKQQVESRQTRKLSPMAAKLLTASLPSSLSAL